MKEKWSDGRGGVVLLEAEEEEDDDHGETARDARSPAAATAAPAAVDVATNIEDERDEHDDLLLADGSAGLDDE